MKNLIKITANLFLYLFSFFLFTWIKTRILGLHEEFREYFIIFTAAWLISTLMTRKYKFNKDSNYETIAKKHILSFVLMLFILTVAEYFYGLKELSRFVIVGSVVVPHLLELVILRVYVWIYNPKSLSKPTIIIQYNFFRELFFLIAVSLIVLFSSIDYRVLVYEHAVLIIGIFAAWFLAHIFSSHFESTHRSTKFWGELWKYAKTNIIFIVLTGFMIFLVRLKSEYILDYFKIPVYYSFLSSFVFLFIYVNKIPRSTDEVSPKLKRATNYPESLSLNVTQSKNGSRYKVSEDDNFGAILRAKLKDIYLAKFGTIFEFIDNNIDLSSVNFIKAVVIRSSDVYNVEVLPGNSLTFFMNLHEMNDIRRLNEYFIKVNQRLIDGGIFAFQFEPIKYRFARFLTKYPTYLAWIFYTFDFIWRRAIPKLPLVKKFYFALTKGRNRAISLAEGIGRLYYCGFELIDMKEVSHKVFVLAKKEKAPSDDPNPSYGLFFKMLRVGQDGKLFYVYKLRTMHPYAEYLQKFVYEKFSLKQGGKFNDDFRITSWGRVFRKLWIDEFPMFINLFRGDIKFVGVRPLSKHYLSLYEEEIKLKRFKTKPGLVPPFYADMPNTLEEIMRSEEIYLDSYFKKPLTTDVKYFFKAFYNIAFKNARSG